MLKEFAEYLQKMKENKTYEFHGQVYSDHELVRIQPHVDRPDELVINGLDSCVKLVKRELGKAWELPIYIRVVSPREVEVFTSLDPLMERDWLYRVKCDAPEFREGFREYENAVIELRSCFEPTEDLDYLLELLASINRDDGVKTEDNGVSQVVTVTQGVHIKDFQRVKPRVTLAPYRTFTEVRQPASEFILRLDDEQRVGLIGADGGRWRLAAKEAICGLFEEALAEEIEGGAVVVMK